MPANGRWDLTRRLIKGLTREDGEERLWRKVCNYQTSTLNIVEGRRSQKVMYIRAYVTLEISGGGTGCRPRSESRLLCDAINTNPLLCTPTGSCQLEVLTVLTCRLASMFRSTLNYCARIPLFSPLCSRSVFLDRRYNCCQGPVPGPGISYTWP